MKKWSVLDLTESFILNDLDLQVRFHYAPRDSKSHKVEQVMSALNDAVGDGRFIDLNRRSVMDIYTEKQVLQMTPVDFKKAQEKEDQEVGFRCGEKVSERYNGTACMFTTIHSKVTDKKQIHQMFFFDEKYMKKCCFSTSDKKLNECAGQFYFRYLLEEFDKHYIRYKNGIEGIKIDKPFRFPGHLQRIQAAIPDFSSKETDGSWHYFRAIPSTLPNQYDDLVNDTPNQFCPIEQLHQFVESVGNPDIDIQRNRLSVNVTDRNDTWSKISAQLEEFIDNYTGQDLAKNVRKEAEKFVHSETQKELQKSPKTQSINTRTILSCHWLLKNESHRNEDCSASSMEWNNIELKCRDDKYLHCR